MPLSVVLEHPDVGVVTPPIVSGALEHVLDRYPRYRLTLVTRPNPGGLELWQSPYGTRAYVFQRSGELMFSGEIISADVQRPDGAFGLEGADPISLLSAAKFSERKGQFLPGSTMDVPAFIRLVATRTGVTVTVTGTGGLVDVRALDIAGKGAWELVEEALIGNDLDVWVQPNGALQVGPTAVLKPTPDHSIGVGNAGTITGFQVALARVFNRVILTHEAQKDGQPESKYVDGIWQDDTSVASVARIGPNVFTKTVRVGADWWDNPAGHQAQAHANAAGVAQAIRGVAREATIQLIPDYAIKVGHTVQVTFRKGVVDRFLVTRTNWPLGAGEMELTCRNPDPAWPGSTFIKQPSRRLSHA